MKSIFKFSLILFLALSMSACDSSSNNDDDDDNNNNIPGGSGSMTADIDGTGWSAANATATKITALGFTTMTIAGADASGNAMTISFVGVVAPGSFTLGGNNLASMSYILNASADAYLATSGQATITTINDDEVKGVFSFSGLRTSDGATVIIGAGTFDVGYGISPF